MRVRIDMDLCQGHGVCCEEAPTVFELDGDKVRLRATEVPEDQHDAVRLAVKYCPTMALGIEEE